MAKRSYQAMLEKTVKEGKHGPYAVTRSDLLGLVTFSLDKPVWQEEEWPEPGTIIVVSDLIKKKSGWRARNARFFEPGDEQISN